MNHIELFAGCGGLSLGLEQSGFERVLANELSPMAAETFAYNFLGEDLEEKATQNGIPQKVRWIKSDFQSLRERLRENPFNISGKYSDLDDISCNEDLRGNLLVGSIVDLNNTLQRSPSLAKALACGFQSGGSLDLVSGGPPCQSFSMAGKREKDNEKNALPWEFASFVNIVKPKIVLLENVTGILRAFQVEDGSKFHAWYEVSKVFASIGYVPLCLHVNARHVGVPQNRPRFIMIAVRQDTLTTFLENSPMMDKKVWEESLNFFQLTTKDVDSVPFGILSYLDSMKISDTHLFKDTFLSPLVEFWGRDVSVFEAIDDLKVHNPSLGSDYVSRLNGTFTVLGECVSLLNHDLRKNSPIVKRRFRVYQILQQLDDRALTKRVFEILRGNETTLNEEDWGRLKRYRYLHENGELHSFKTKEQFEHYLLSHPTKKQTQKALVADSPAPAALSIPDDACHYDEQELRVLSVREMARIQSFPDNFVFRSKITTGGKMRRFEVPQYTQVGNAVPPLLGKALGKVISTILDRC